MKRLFVFFIVMLAGVSAALAQKGLAINQLFDGRYKKAPNAVVTYMRGGSLENYDLEIYRSISITNPEKDADVITSLLSKDAQIAVDRTVSYNDGKLYYAFYQLPPGKCGNRYILYVNQTLKGGNKLVLMYLEGEASPRKVKNLLKGK